MKIIVKKIGVAFFLVVFISSFYGCAGFMKGKKTHKKSSVVEFLYPGRGDVVIKPSVPHLTLPINVGVAFVPESSHRYSKRSLSSKIQFSLMDKIADNFRQYKFVKNVEVIPSEYLRSGGGFDNLEQLKTMYGIDVMVLLSYDQIQYTDEGFVSLMYWTIVGAYIFNGEKNDTSTMIDAAVYDIKSRKMLFRAPGTSQVKGSATLVNLSEELRKDSTEGFNLATPNLLKNLAMQLERFKTKIKERPEEVKVTYSRGYSGGGYFGSWFAVLFIMLLGIATLYGRKQKS